MLDYILRIDFFREQGLRGDVIPARATQASPCDGEDSGNRGVGQQGDASVPTLHPHNPRPYADEYQQEIKT